MCSRKTVSNNYVPISLFEKATMSSLTLIKRSKSNLSTSDDSKETVGMIPCEKVPRVTFLLLLFLSVSGLSFLALYVIYGTGSLNSSIPRTVHTNFYCRIIRSKCTAFTTNESVPGTSTLESISFFFVPGIFLTKFFLLSLSIVEIPNIPGLSQV